MFLSELIKVGLFGPIVENAILTANVLPGLVRATAINASRAVQATKPGYRHPYPFLMIS